MSGSPHAEPLRIRLRRALPGAMKARDPVAVAALRSALAAIDNAEAVPPDAPPMAEGPIAGAAMGAGAGEAARRELTESRIVAIVHGEVAERLAAAADYEQVGRPDRAARVTAEAEVLSGYLVV